MALGRRNARILDDLLSALFSGVASGKLESDRGRAVPAGAFGLVELAGVGSYGRGAVALKSDLDVRVCSKSVQKAEAVADALLYPLWDMGVAIGHQVVSIDDLVGAARDDLPTATTLLDWRHVAGDQGISQALRKRCEETLFAHSELRRFLGRLEDEVAQRHGRFGGSVYLLEPDVKNGEGGLRDLDVARWAAKARFGVGEPEELVRIGALVPREAAEIAEASELLFRVRNLLHAHAGRRSDRLSFDEQEIIAPLLGFGPGGDGVERLMSAYYRAARIISRALEMTLARATPILSRKKPRDEDLGQGVRMFDGAVTLQSHEALRGDPALALRLVSVAVDRGVCLLPYARDAIGAACADAVFGEALRQSPEAKERFVDLVASTRETSFRAGSVRRELHATGLILAMIPEFSPVVGRVHHDTYHVYTVDVHSVAAADRLATLMRGELAGDFPLACRLAAEATRPKMLFFATLLHDVGKAIGGTDHSRRGASMAVDILTRLGFPPDDVEEACHLILKHLVMYHAATRRDLEEPATIQDLCRDVRSREGLRDLYLLTVSDLSTTSPTSMTTWKARMLDELYLTTDAALNAGGVERWSAPDGADARWSHAALLAQEAMEARPADTEEERAARRAFLGEYLESMPERYVIANGAEAVVAHAELARLQLAGAGGPPSGGRTSVAPVHDGGSADSADTASPWVPVVVDVVPSRHPAAVEICVVAPDRNGLLAAITAALAASRLEVHAAQIHSRPIGTCPGPGVRRDDLGYPPGREGGPVQAVDLFWVQHRGSGLSGVARALPKLRRDIGRVLAGEVAPAELARKGAGGSLKERATPRVTIEVSIDDRASPRHTVIEVLARDRPGLLFAVSDALHRLGLSIAIAKINTEGTRVADVFYVSEADGGKVAPGKRSAEVHHGLIEALEGLEAEGR
jgi:[protein-PII] uridylyltransferase